MSVLTRWNPFREMEDIQNRMNSLLGRTSMRINGEEGFSLSDWSPAVDIIEDDKEYVIKAELPGVKKEDVKVKVEEGTLYISGERKFEKEEKGKKYHRIECAYGSFTRSFSLPEDVKSEQVHADYKDGVLNLRVPRSSPETKPKSKAIEIKIE